MRTWPTAALSLLLSLALTSGAVAGGPYEPYEVLIGEWDVGPPAGTPAMVLRFRWGTNRAYIWHGANILKKDGEEPHFEGVFMWNPQTKKLDMLLMLDVTERAAAQESGTLSIEADGTIVRNITGTFPNGTARFRQTYRRLSADRMETTVLRETQQGWAPTFPGSEHLVMTRRPTK